MSSNTGGLNQNVSFQNVTTGDMQNSVAGQDSILGDGNIIQKTEPVAPENKPITQPQVIELLTQLETLIKSENLPPELKEKAAKSLAAAKEEAKEEEPDKNYIKNKLEKVTGNLKAATETIVASQGLWSKAKDIFIKLAPWLGVAASVFLGTP